MRILFAADVRPDPDSGAAGTEYQTCQALQRLGHEVECIWADELRRRISHGNLHYLLELPRSYRNAIRARSRNRHFDVYHVNQPHCFLAAVDHKRSGRNGVFVHRSHGLEERVRQVVSGWRRRWKQPEKSCFANLASTALQKGLERHSDLAAQYCDGTIVSSSLCRDFLINRYGVARHKVALIPQAPPDIFQDDPPPRLKARQRRILYVGQFAFVKGPMLVADVFRELASDYPDASFTWVADRRHHGEIKALLGPAAHRCRLLPWMPQTALMQIYDEHGVLVFPSLCEGFGKTFLEALSRGLCVLSSDEGGMRDVIKQGENGFVTPVGDVAALLSAARFVMKDFDLFSRVCTAARSTAISYTWSRVGRETAEFYTQLAEYKLRDSSAAPSFHRVVRCSPFR